MSQAAIPTLLTRTHAASWTQLVVVATGILFMALLSHVSIPLPWSPVPITGQTFGVALIGLTAGRRLATSILLGYLCLGFLGAPMFASAAKLGTLLPTSGYLIGFLVAANAVGWLADRGWSRTFPRSLAAAYAGSFFIFVFGLIWLSFFIPKAAVFSAGLYPFLIGDLIKNILAAALGNSFTRRSVST